MIGNNSQNNYATNSNILPSSSISEAPHSTSNYQTQGDQDQGKFRLDAIGPKNHVNYTSNSRQNETYTNSTKSS